MNILLVTGAIPHLEGRSGSSVVLSGQLTVLAARHAVTLVTFAPENQSEATALAREPHDKKGMDEMQITGATSSYARKYALNGLFCIDDSKDADADNSLKIDYPEMTEIESGIVTDLISKLKKSAPKGLLPDREKIARYLFSLILKRDGDGRYPGDPTKIPAILKTLKPEIEAGRLCVKEPAS